MNTDDLFVDLNVAAAKLKQERDEWRKVADELAAELDELNFALGDSDAQLKFQELEKKYPL